MQQTHKTSLLGFSDRRLHKGELIDVSHLPLQMIIQLLFTLPLLFDLHPAAFVQVTPSSRRLARPLRTLPRSLLLTVQFNLPATSSSLLVNPEASILLCRSKKMNPSTILYSSRTSPPCACLANPLGCCSHNACNATCLPSIVIASAGTLSALTWQEPGLLFSVFVSHRLPSLTRKPMRPHHTGTRKRQPPGSRPQVVTSHITHTGTGRHKVVCRNRPTASPSYHGRRGATRGKTPTASPGTAGQLHQVTQHHHIGPTLPLTDRLWSLCRPGCQAHLAPGQSTNRGGAPRPTPGGLVRDTHAKPPKCRSRVGRGGST